MKVSEWLNVNPGLLATYANELLRSAMPEGYTVGVWRGDPVPIFAVKTYKIGEGRPPENPDPDKVTITFVRWSAPTPRDYHEEDAGLLVALRSSAGCLVSGEIADDLAGVWAAFLDDVRKLQGEKPTKPHKCSPEVRERFRLIQTLHSAHPGWTLQDIADELNETIPQKLLRSVKRSGDELTAQDIGNAWDAMRKEDSSISLFDAGFDRMEDRRPKSWD